MPFNPFAPDNIAVAIIAMNFFAFAAFGIDKARAELGKWRIKESTLLTLAALGGTLGAYAGRAAFRHKTRKQPFSFNLHVIAGLQVALIGWIMLGAPLPGGLRDRAVQTETAASRDRDFLAEF